MAVYFTSGAVGVGTVGFFFLACGSVVLGAGLIIFLSDFSEMLYSGTDSTLLRNLARCAVNSTESTEDNDNSYEQPKQRKKFQKSPQPPLK